MKFFYPRSFAALLFVGFGLVVLPSLAGMLHLRLLLEQVVETSGRQVKDTVAITRGTRRLSEGALALERAAGQLFVLDDPQLKDRVSGAHEDFLAVLDELRPLPWDAERRRLLGSIAGVEDSLYQDVLAGHEQGEADFSSFAERFDTLHGHIATMIDEGNQAIDQGVQALNARAQKVLRILLVQGLAIILLSLVLVVFFSWLINRPVGQLAHLIRRLGENVMDPGPPVYGPRDLVYLGERLDWLRRRLAELEEQKQRFLHHVSHELKTPLAALREGVELLADGIGGAPSEQQQEILGILQDNGRELQHRIDDLLRYNRAAGRGEALVLGECRMDELLDAATERHRLTLQSRGIQLERELELESLTVQGDRGKLATVIENLLGNAIRFSPAGGTIDVTIHRVDDNVVMTVRDQGPGVAPEDRSNLFQPFYQGHNQPPGALQGTGLGLAIVREYVTAHGGRVRLRESNHEGACFEVVLPPRQDVDADS